MRGGDKLPYYEYKEWKDENGNILPWKRIANKRAQCKKKGIPFDLTTEWYERQWEKGCALSGIKFETIKGRFTAAINRIDKNKGYLKDNCRLVIYGLQALMEGGDDDTVIEIAKAIVKRNS